MVSRCSRENNDEEKGDPIGILLSFLLLLFPLSRNHKISFPLNRHYDIFVVRFRFQSFTHRSCWVTSSSSSYCNAHEIKYQHKYLRKHWIHICECVVNNVRQWAKRCDIANKKNSYEIDGRRESNDGIFNIYFLCVYTAHIQIQKWCVCFVPICPDERWPIDHISMRYIIDGQHDVKLCTIIIFIIMMTMRMVNMCKQYSRYLLANIFMR